MEISDDDRSEIKKMGKIKGVVVHIPINKEIQPVVQPYRRVPAPLEKAVDDRINEMLQSDVIEKVNQPSEWVSPVVVVPKQSGEIRLCVDMRRANQAVQRENHPLPTIETFLPHIGTGKLFSKLDVRDAFHQLELAEESRFITTFITKRGLFRYKRLMFGINCAPEIFQKTMEHILNGLEGCLCFMDDIVVYGATESEHNERLRKVLQRLSDFNVALNDTKCVYGVTALDFLGHRLSVDGIAPMADKISAVKEFRAPRTPEEVRSFLGLVNYVAKFIPNLATITDSLRQLTKKDVKFEWNLSHNEKFEQLKDYITKEPVLGYYNVNRRTRLIADASPVGLGAVLIQFDEVNTARVISYASRSLTTIEKRYAQTEKEALALVWAVERFYYYLYGKEFELITDHKPLEVIFGPKSKPCARIERWVLRIQSFRYKVIFKPGKTNIADPLSRLLADTEDVKAQNVNSDYYVDWVEANAAPKAIKLAEIETESATDSTIQLIKKAIEENNWPSEIQQYKIYEMEFCFSGNILLRGTRIVMPEALRERVLNLAHEGHPGIVVMKRRLRSKVWWSKMDQQVEMYVKRCHGCAIVSAPSAPEPIKRTKLPSQPWDHLAIDFCGPLPSGHYLFVVVDYFSRFTEVKIMTKTETKDTIDALEEIFERFGNPLSITCDNGPQFISAGFKEFCDENDIAIISTTPYWPQQNGEVERQNRSLLKRIKISQNTNGNWRKDLRTYLKMYRSTPHSVTMKSPGELMFNRTMRDKLPSIEKSMPIDEELHDRDKEAKEKGRIYANGKRHAKTSEIKEGDSVLIKRQKIENKLQSPFLPTAYKVIKRNGAEVTVENSETSEQYRRNVAHVKKIPDDDNELETQQHLPLLPGSASDDQPLTKTPAEINSNNREGTDQPAIDNQVQLPAKRRRVPPTRFQAYQIEN